MADLSPHTGLNSCACSQCFLVRVGGYDVRDPMFALAELAGEMAVTLYLLTRCARLIRPANRWCGDQDWFRLMGKPLDFSEDLL